MKKPRRAPGEGWVERLPSGRHRVRVPMASGSYFDPHETFATEEEADEVRAAIVKRLQEEGRSASGVVTFLSFGELTVERRRKLGRRGEGSIFRTHLARAHFARWPIQNIRRRDCKRWLDSMNEKQAAPGHGHKKKRTGRAIARSTILNALTLLRQIFHEAVEDEYIDANPALGLRVKKDERTEEPWTYLTYEEQVALLQATPEPKREIVAIALCLGVRLEELWLLRLSDVHLKAKVPFVVIRYGRREGNRLFPPKNGKIREVPLLGWALPAMQAWLSRPLGKNKHGVVFPGGRGGYRARKKSLRGYASFVRAAGIDRHVRWHDLRHTCASSLVAGWWGRAWSLEEVCAMLGHTSIRVTERYAHLAPSMLQRAALETGGRALPALLGTPAGPPELHGSSTLNDAAAVFPRTR